MQCPGTPTVTAQNTATQRAETQILPHLEDVLQVDLEETNMTHVVKGCSWRVREGIPEVDHLPGGRHLPPARRKDGGPVAVVQADNSTVAFGCDALRLQVGLQGQVPGHQGSGARAGRQAAKGRVCGGGGECQSWGVQLHFPAGGTPWVVPCVLDGDRDDPGHGNSLVCRMLPWKTQGMAC